MYSQIKIDIEGFESFDYDGYPTEYNMLDNLINLNIFIGANNSGKSRLNRWIFSKNDFYYNLHRNNNEKFKDKYNELKILIRGSQEPEIININELLKDYLLNFSKNTTDKNFDVIKEKIIELNSKYLSRTYTRTFNPTRINIQQKLTELFEIIRQINISNDKITSVYIPILRGL